MLQDSEWITEGLKLTTKEGHIHQFLAFLIEEGYVKWIDPETLTSDAAKKSCGWPGAQDVVFRFLRFIAEGQRLQKCVVQLSKDCPNTFTCDIEDYNNLIILNPYGGPASGNQSTHDTHRIHLIPKRVCNGCI